MNQNAIEKKLYIEWMESLFVPKLFKTKLKCYSYMYMYMLLKKRK